MKAVVWEDEALGAKYHDEEIPAELPSRLRAIARRSSKRLSSSMMM